MNAQGDNENYYDPSNSLLPFVLAQKKGIPISLAIVHAAVGRRAGLPIEFVGMPMHFMNKLRSDNSQDERFIDVFAGGRILDRLASLSVCCVSSLSVVAKHQQKVAVDLLQVNCNLAILWACWLEGLLLVQGLLSSL